MIARERILNEKIIILYTRSVEENLQKKWPAHDRGEEKWKVRRRTSGVFEVDSTHRNASSYARLFTRASVCDQDMDVSASAI